MNNGTRGTPEDLRRVEAALDALAERERDSAPARLEQGVYLASLRHLAGQEEPVIARIRPVILTRSRIAAAVAVVAGVGMAWLASTQFNGGNGSALASANRLEDDVNFVLDLRASADDLGIMGERIDVLYMDTRSVGDSLKSDATLNLLGDGAL